MKTMTLAFAAFLTLAPFASPIARAADPLAGDPQIDRVLERYAEAIGGRAAVEKLTSRIMKASLEGLGMPAAVNWTLYAKTPNKQVSEMEIAGMGTIQEGFDGQVAWSKNPFAGLRIKEGEELAKQKRDADFHRELHLTTTYTNLTAKGTEKVNGADAFVLEAKPTANALERWYFDAASGLLVRQDSEFSAADGRMKLRVLFSDYRPVDGVKYPHLMRFSAAAEGQPGAEFSITVKEVKHNQTIDDSKFAKPAA